MHAGELQIRPVRVAIIPLRGRLLGESFLHRDKRRVGLGQEPRALAERRRAATGIAVGDVDRTLLDQIHDSAQVAADDLQSVDAERLLPRKIQGIVDVGDQFVCAVEEIDGRAPGQERLEAAGREWAGVLRSTETVAFAVAAVQVRLRA